MSFSKTDWKRRTIADLCDFSGGYGFKPSDWAKSGLPIIRIQNLNGSKNFNYFNGTPEPEWLVQPGELLFAWAGVRGVSFGPTIWNGQLGVLNQHIYRIHPKAGVEKDWLFLALKLVTSRIEAKAHGFKSSLVHVRKSDIDSQVVFVPEEASQKHIAEITGSWDTAIRKCESLLAANVDRKVGLMQQLVTGQTRFKEFVKSSKKVKTRYGDFPEDWSQVHMCDIASEVGKKNGDGKELPVLSCTKHRGLVNSLEYFGKRIHSENTNTYRIVERGDFAYATNHIEEGSIGYQNLHAAALISPMYTVFRTKPGVDHEFFWKLIKTELYRHIFEVNTSGSIARRGALRWDEFALIKVFLPTVAEQKRIAAVLNTCDEEIKLLEQQLEALKEQKRGLMQKLLTGEFRVKV